MKIHVSTARLGENGYALMLVIFFAGISVLILSGAMNWTSTNARNNDRNNRYFAAVAAAEGATEVALASMSQDFFVFGENEVYNNMGAQRYATNVPVTAHDSYWRNYAFSTPAGISNNSPDGMSYIYRTSLGTKTNPPGTTFAGWYSKSGTYRIIANAQESSAPGAVTASVGQEINFDLTPAFQCAIFYELDLEINPGPNMTVAGKVHSNRNIYTQPQANLTFLGGVTAVDNVIRDKSPLDPSSRSPGNVNFQTPPTENVPPMQIPGVDYTATNSAHRILEYPPDGEDRNSVAGKERYYNKADMVVVVTDNGIIVTNGPNRPAFNPLSQNEARVFINTNASFWNEREGLKVQATEIDVAKLEEWARTNAVGARANTLFVDDQRSTTRNIAITNTYYSTNYTTNFTMTTGTTVPAPGTYRPPVITNCNTFNQTNNSLPGIPPRCPGFTPFQNAQGRWVYRTIANYSYERITVITTVITNRVITTNNLEFAESGVRLANGELLPSGGLTVASPDPVYIWGDYNVTDGSGFSRGTSNTDHTRPASVIADAINVLSEGWLDSRSTNAVDQRVALNTTVNAAFLGGIVPSDGTHYSGGVENFPRFLEKWENSGKRIFTYNGSMIVLFESEIATAPWGSPNVYVPPQRNWTFDMNFNDINKLPPGSPNFQRYERARWATLRPGDDNF